MVRRLPPPLAGSPPIDHDPAPDGPRVLVAGGTVAALALTTWLGRTGHRVTHVNATRETATPNGPTLLPRQTVETLADCIPGGSLDGLTRPVTEHRIDGPQCSLTLASDADPPLWLDVPDLYRRLDRRQDGATRRDDAVDHLRDVPDGIEVTFADGSRATYDVVVAADGQNSFVGSLTGAVHEFQRGLHEWSTSLPRPSAIVSSPCEHWDTAVCVTVVPFDDELAVQVRMPRRSTADHSPRTRAGAALERLDVGLPEPLQSGIPPGSSYRLLPDPTACGTWRAGRVVLCGTAASPLSGFRGLHPTLPVEDSIVLVDSLVAADSVDAALSRYAVDRRARQHSVWNALTDCRPDWTSALPFAGDGPLSLEMRLQSLRFDDEFELVTN